MSDFAVVVCIFSSTHHIANEFLFAVHEAGKNTEDFVYLLPLLQAEKGDKSPWFGDNGEGFNNIKEHFVNTIIVSTFFFFAKILPSLSLSLSQSLEKRISNHHIHLFLRYANEQYSLLPWFW